MSELNYKIALDRGELFSLAASIIPRLRTIYAELDQFVTIADRFGTEPDFEEAFEILTWIGPDDYGVTASNMIFELRQYRNAMKNTDARKAMLGLPIP